MNNVVTHLGLVRTSTCRLLSLDKLNPVFRLSREERICLESLGRAWKVIGLKDGCAENKDG